MSIEKVEMYTVICDNCGWDVGVYDEFAAYNNAAYASENAVDNFDWVKQDENHYCPKCYEYDDEDNLILKPKPTNND